MASIDLPDDEQLIVEGVITTLTPVGGGEEFAPPETQVVIVGQAISITREVCQDCGLPHQQRDSGPFGVGSYVVVSWLASHRHYVVRVVPRPAGSVTLA